MSRHAIRKVFTWIGIGLGVLVGLNIFFTETGFTIGTSHLNKTHHLGPADVNIPEDAAAIERGEYLNATSCTGCHGDDLGYLDNGGYREQLAFNLGEIHRTMIII